MTPAEARRWATAECDAWNALDLDRIIARYADDVTLSSPAVVTRMDQPDGRLRGRAEVRDYFAIGLRAPGLRFELLEVFAGLGARRMIFRRETGVVVCDVFEFDDRGRVARLTACHGDASGGPRDRAGARLTVSGQAWGL
jgi:hypothetical protein